MAILFLARHGETVWNVEKMYRRRMDVNMDEMGITQAELLGKYLTRWELEAMYSVWYCHNHSICRGHYLPKGC